MFRFTIRDLLLITITVAMICGWLEEHVRARSLSAKLADAESQLAKQAVEIQRLKTVNEITAYQWKKALGMIPPSRP